MSDSPAIEIRDLHVAYGSRDVLQGVCLEVPPGRKVLITGPSGSGKSTLLHSLLGFVRPGAGEIRIQGRPVDSQTVWQSRRKLGFVDQEPQMGQGTVREILHRPFEYQANRSLARNLSDVPDWFERLELEAELLDAPIAKLSGGEKQRVALVAALLLDRPILLLDEATSALDPPLRKRAVDVLGSRDDLTILAVAHDEQWREMAHREVSLARGAVR
jgi:ABC-type multidrug transport system fused ATPase/permease subunit